MIDAANISASFTGGLDAPGGYVKASVVSGPDGAGVFTLRLDGGREMSVIVEEGKAKADMAPGQSVFINPSNGMILVPDAAQGQPPQLPEQPQQSPLAGQPPQTPQPARTPAEPFVNIRADVFTPGELAKQIRDGLESPLLRSLPAELIEKIASERGGIDVAALNALDAILRNRSLPLDASSPLTLERVEQWLRIALDNPKLIEGLAARVPLAGAREIIDKLLQLQRIGANFLPNNLLQQLSAERFFLGNGAENVPDNISGSGANNNAGIGQNTGLNAADAPQSALANAVKGDLLKELFAKAFSAAPSALLDLVKRLDSSDINADNVKLPPEEARKIVGELVKSLRAQAAGKPELVHDIKQLTPRLAETANAPAIQNKPELSNTNIIPNKADLPNTHIISSRTELPNKHIIPDRGEPSNTNIILNKSELPNSNIIPNKSESSNIIPNRADLPNNNIIPNRPESSNIIPNKADSSSVNIVPTRPDTPNTRIIPNKYEPPTANIIPNKIDLPYSNIIPNKSESSNIIPNKADLPNANIILNKSESSNIISVKSELPNANVIPNKSESSNIIPNKVDLSNSNIILNKSESSNIISVKSELPAQAVFEPSANANANARHPVPQNIYDRIESAPSFNIPAESKNAVFSQIVRAQESIRQAVGARAEAAVIPANTNDLRTDNTVNKPTVHFTQQASISGAPPSPSPLPSPPPPQPSTPSPQPAQQQAVSGETIVKQAVSGEVNTGNTDNKPISQFTQQATDSGVNTDKADNRHTQPPPDALTQTARLLLDNTEKLRAGFQEAFASLDLQSRVFPSDFSGGAEASAVRRSLDALRLETLLNASKALQNIFSIVDELRGAAELFSGESREPDGAEKLLARAAEDLARQARIRGNEIADRLNDILRGLNRMQPDGLKGDGAAARQTPAEIMRSAALTAAGGLESLHLLASAARGQELQQQVVALPVKIGDEWTEVQVKIIKERKGKGKKEKKEGGGHVSVYLNVAPSKLGEVSARLDYYPPAGLKLSFQFGKPEAAKWFREQAGALREALSLSGLPGAALEFHVKPRPVRAQSVENQEVAPVGAATADSLGRVDFKA